MKKFTLVIAILLMSFNSMFAQKGTKNKDEIYPDKYTFAKAYEFQSKGEYNKAIWFYINLFPDNKTQVVDTVKALALKMDHILKRDTTEMSSFIKISFCQYATFDPTISSFSNGGFSMNAEKMTEKGAWGDELIQKITDPNKPLSSGSEYNFRGQDKVQLGDFKGAIAVFDTAISLNPKPLIYFNRAYAKSLIGDFKGAIEDYNKVIESNSGYAKAYFERGFCKSESGNYQGAIDDYTEAIKLKKDFADAYCNRGVSNFKLQKAEDALKDFNKAIQITPDFANAYLNRGFAKIVLKDKKGACKDWAKAAELGIDQANTLIKENCE